MSAFTHLTPAERKAKQAAALKRNMARRKQAVNAAPDTSKSPEYQSVVSKELVPEKACG